MLAIRILSRARSPERIAATASSTRAFSETTWRHRFRTTGGSAAKNRASSSGPTSRRERTPGRSDARIRTPSSHSARRLLYSDDPREWRTPLLTTTILSPAGISTVSCASDRQSRSSAFPCSPNVEAIWSMIPQATPTKPFSASRASFATSSDGSSKSPSADNRRTVATS